MKIFQEGANAEKTSLVQHLTGPSNKAFFLRTQSSVTRLGDLLDSGQVFKTFGNN